MALPQTTAPPPSKRYFITCLMSLNPSPSHLDMSLFPVTHTHPAPSSPTQEEQPREDRDETFIGYTWVPCILGSV